MLVCSMYMYLYHTNCVSHTILFEALNIGGGFVALK